MLEAVNTIHEERIVHSDLKPANFMLVRGSLKLIDFGIAKAIMNDTTNIQRDSQVHHEMQFAFKYSRAFFIVAFICVLVRISVTTSYGVDYFICHANL